MSPSNIDISIKQNFDPDQDFSRTLQVSNSQINIRHDGGQGSSRYNKSGSIESQADKQLYTKLK